MAVISIPELKAKFETGQIPIGGDFVDLIDTLAASPASALAYTASPGYSLYGVNNVAPSAAIEKSIQLGVDADVVADSAIAIGYSALVENGATAGIAIGFGATVQQQLYANTNAIAIGVNATVVTYGMHSIAIGNSSNAGSDYVVALGPSASATGNYGVAVGNAASAGSRGVAIGPGAQSSTNGVAIGNGVIAAANSVRIGVSSTSFIEFDDFTPAAGATTPGYYIEIELNGGRYKIPLEAIP